VPHRPSVLRSFTRSVEPASYRSSLAMLVLCAAWLIPLAYRGWIPHDQGILAQSALRVLQGELPHRDFDELYTGAESYLNALAFLLWGEQLSSIRTMFLGFALVFVWFLHRVARRLIPPGVAEVTVLTSLAWGLTNYFEAMPSWYNLFFIVFGMAAMLRYFDSGRVGWLFWVGWWGGVSLLFKIVGLYYIAAIYVILVVDVHWQASARSNKSGPAPRWLLTGAACAVCVIWLTLVVLMTRRNADVMLVLQLIIPAIAVGVAATVVAFRHRTAAWSDVTTVLRTWAWFTVGVSLPVSLFLIPYILSGALLDLYRGLFVLPFTRLTGASYAFPAGWQLHWVIGFWFCMGMAVVLRPGWNRVVAGVGILLVLLVGALPYWFSRELVLVAARMMPPAIVLVAGWVLVDRSGELKNSTGRQLFLTLTLAAFCSLSQFPFAAPIYFCFIATLYLLCVQQLMTLPRLGFPVSAWILAGSGLLLGMVYINRHTFFDDPREVALDPPTQLLDVPRGGLFVSGRDRDTYQRLVGEIQSHCQPTETLWATPDCPEVYFLAERDNPTRTFLEFIEVESGAAQATLQLLDEYSVKVLVLNLEPRHSPKLAAEVVAELTGQFAQTVSIGHFLVCYERLSR
jgi:hypothetical protein